ncbi:MAG: ribonuclease HII [Actinomycetota bacterium]|nr:ribonuclease HII [Actinomycetota bacterium]
MAPRQDRGDRLTGDLVRYERVLREQGFTRVAGADEAGRGALAGPLVAAAVVLPEGFDTQGIDDSKLLTRLQREAAYERIVAAALFAVARAEPAVIDRRGLHRSNLALLRRCIRALDPVPEYALTDGFPVPRMPCPSLGIKRGDAVAVSVAAASIVAKVTRDRIMDRMHRRYPAWGFDHNRGYGTPDHLEVLDRLGPTPIHRLSFACVGQASLPGMGRSVGLSTSETDKHESMTR